MYQCIREGRLYMRKIEIISVWAMKLVGRAKNVEIFYFWIDFWKLLNQSFSIFYMSNFQIFSKNLFFSLFPGFPGLLTVYYKNMDHTPINEASLRLESLGFPFFSIVWKICGRDRASFDRKNVRKRVHRSLKSRNV